MTDQWFQVDNIDEIDSPALLIYSDRVKHNISLAIKMVGEVSRLRPHVKTHKSPEVTELMLDAGITKFKCATIAEAEMLAQCKAPDILLAYQPTGPKTTRLLNLTQQYPFSKISCLVDSAEAANAIAKKASDANLKLNVFIDVNVGMNRTGTLPEGVIDLYHACRQLTSIRVIGIHGYDGHINDTDLAIREKRADEVYQQLKQVQEALKTEGLDDISIVIGGSPTFIIHSKRKDVECSPGTFVYWDKNYQDQFPDMQFLPAVLALSRVVSVINENKICLDLGHKSIAAENPLARRVHFLNAETLQVIGQSEEHLVVDTFGFHDYKIGDVLYGMPFHVCPTCALYNTAYVVNDRRVKEEWQITARDRRLSI